MAIVHIEKKKANMTDLMYRNLIERVTGVRSCIDLSDRQLIAVADAIRAAGTEKRVARHPEHNSDPQRGPLLKKIAAQLSSAGRSWEYVDSIVRRRFYVERIEFCSAVQLRKLVAMLAYDAQRHGRVV